MKDEQARPGRVNWKGADLYGARMQGVEAQQTDFRGADLRWQISAALISKER